MKNKEKLAALLAAMQLFLLSGCTNKSIEQEENSEIQTITITNIEEEKANEILTTIPISLEDGCAIAIKEESEQDKINKFIEKRNEFISYVENNGILPVMGDDDLEKDEKLKEFHDYFIKAYEDVSNSILGIGDSITGEYGLFVNRMLFEVLNYFPNCFEKNLLGCNGYIVEWTDTTNKDIKWRREALEGRIVYRKYEKCQITDITVTASDLIEQIKSGNLNEEGHLRYVITLFEPELSAIEVKRIELHEVDKDNVLLLVRGLDDSALDLTLLGNGKCKAVDNVEVINSEGAKVEIVNLETTYAKY